MISIESKGSFKRSGSLLTKLLKLDITATLHRYGREGVAALSAATPRESGATAASWDYEVTKTRNGWAITWSNHHVVGGSPLVIMLQYGHGTGTGGYVAGEDFINPAIKPIFDRIKSEVWKVVKSA